MAPIKRRDNATDRAALRAVWWRQHLGALAAMMLPPSMTPAMREVVLCPDHNLAFSHVFKSAGSSVDALLRAQCPHAVCLTPSGQGSCGYLSPVARARVAAYAAAYGNRTGRLSDFEASGIHVPGLRTVSVDESSWFTVVRDPVSRFESAIAQLILSGKGPRNATCAWALQAVHRRGFFNEHLLPQAAFLFLSGRKPLPLSAIYDVDGLSALAKLFPAGADSNLGREESVPQIHATSMAESQRHCDPSEQARVRDIYRVDMLLFEAAGWGREP